MKRNGRTFLRALPNWDVVAANDFGRLVKLLGAHDVEVGVSIAGRSIAPSNPQVHRHPDIQTATTETGRDSQVSHCTQRHYVGSRVGILRRDEFYHCSSKSTGHDLSAERMPHGFYGKGTHVFTVFRFINCFNNYLKVGVRNMKHEGFKP